MAGQENGSRGVTDQEKDVEGVIDWIARVVVASVAVWMFLAIFNS